MASLKFETDENGEPIKEALGMYSKENEYVNFTNVCNCAGQVNISLYIIYIYICIPVIKSTYKFYYYPG